MMTVTVTHTRQHRQTEVILQHCEFRVALPWELLYADDRYVTDKVGNQKTLYYTISNNLCFCTSWQNAETRKSHILLNWIVLHIQCTYALSSWKKKIVICAVSDSI